MAPSGPPKPISRTIKHVQRRLRGIELDQLVSGYQSGATVYELAEQFGVHRTTVSASLKRKGVVLKDQPLSPNQVADAIQFYHEGLSLLRVGEEVGCHAETVRQALMKAGVEIRPRNGWRRPSLPL